MEVIIFDKTLSQTDVQHRLSFPTAGLYALGIFQGDTFDFIATDISTGRIWPFRLLTRENGDHPKPVLSKGWKAFVQDKGLRENDRVILRRNEGQANGVPFEIQAQRNLIKLFGKDLWVNFEDLHKYGA